MTAVPAVVTLSASFGAGGSVVGPRVAELLGITFLDRAIPTEVARRLAVPLDEVAAHDDRSEHGLGALLLQLGRLPTLAGAPPPMVAGDDRAFKEAAERVIHARAGEGAVVLGRAGAIVLADRPDALHVRLDGPRERRLAAAVARSARSRDEVLREMEANDRTREAYVRHFYRCDPASAQHYHLVVDTTALPVETAVELVVTAARGRGIGPA